MSPEVKMDCCEAGEIKKELQLEQIKTELSLLIYKFLQESGDENSRKILKDEFEKLNIGSMRVNWQGETYPMSFNQLVFLAHCEIQNFKIIRRHSVPNEEVACNLASRSTNDYRIERYDNIPKNYLLESLMKILDFLRNQPNGNHSGVTSLLSKRFTSFQKSVGNFLNLPYAHNIKARKYEFEKKSYHNVTLKKQILGHLAATYCVIFDRTGERIITGSDDTLIKIWRADSSQLLTTLRGHKGEISDLAISYDNRLLASASCDKTVRIWCTFTSEEICILHGHTGKLSSVKFCPRMLGDTGYLISTGNDANLFVWTYTGRTFNPEPIKFNEKLKSNSKLMCSAFSPGGKYLVVGSSDARIYIYLIEETITKIGDFEAHEDRIDSVDFNHFGEKFLTASQGGQAKIWYPRGSSWSSLSLASSMNQDISCHNNGNMIKILSVSWSSDDTYIYGSTRNFQVYVWSAHNGSVLQIFSGHTDSVFVVESHPSLPHIFLTAGHDAKIMIWDVCGENPVKVLHNKIEDGGNGAIFDAKFSPYYFLFAATDNNGHLCIYGTAPDDDYIAFPDHQYFHSDYRPIYSENDVTYDELSGLRPHLLPPPYLVNLDGDPQPSIYQQALLGRFNIFDPLMLEKLGFYKLKNEQQSNHPIGSLPPGSHEGVRQIENIHVSTPVEVEDMIRWKNRIIVPPLSEDKMNEFSIFVKTSYERENKLYKNIIDTCGPQKLNNQHRKNRLLSLKAKVLQNRNDATEEAVSEVRAVENESVQYSQDIIQSEESSFSTATCELTSESEYYSSQSSGYEVKREIRTRHKTYKLENNNETTSNSSFEEISHPPSNPQPGITKDWLFNEKLSRAPYFPQLGDVVVYNLLGHMRYVNYIINNRLYHINKNNLCYNKTTLKHVEVCRVSSIHFLHGYPYTCSLTLTKLDASGTYSTGLNFNVQFTDIPNLDEFLILKQFYDESIERKWEVEDRFQSFIDEKWWEGTIEMIAPFNTKFPKSHFRSIHIIWNSGERDILSPWDIYPMSAVSPNLDYKPDESDWSPENKNEAKHRIMAAFETLQLMPRFSTTENYLNDNIQNVSFPTTYCKIARKLSNNFYRRKKAIIWELRVILQNVISIKAPDDILTTSEILTKTLIHFVKNVCYDINGLINSALAASASVDQIDNSQTILAPHENAINPQPLEVLPEFKWFVEALDLFNYITNLSDSQPFLEPVSLNKYPDYLSFINNPMDFSKIYTNLMSGNYLTPDQFVNDIKTIFNNSRIYNTNRRSTIYSMTLRLNNQFNKKLGEFLPQWREENLRSKVHLTRNKIRDFLNNLNSQANFCKKVTPDTTNKINDTPIAKRLRKRKAVIDDSSDSSHAENDFSNTYHNRRKKLTKDSSFQSPEKRNRQNTNICAASNTSLEKSSPSTIQIRKRGTYLARYEQSITPELSPIPFKSTRLKDRKCLPLKKKKQSRDVKKSFDNDSTTASSLYSELENLRPTRASYNLRSKPNVHNEETKYLSRLRRRTK